MNEWGSEGEVKEDEAEKAEHFISFGSVFMVPATLENKFLQDAVRNFHLVKKLLYLFFILWLQFIQNYVKL